MFLGDIVPRHICSRQSFETRDTLMRTLPAKRADMSFHFAFSDASLVYAIFLCPTLHIASQCLAKVRDSHELENQANSLEAEPDQGSYPG